MSAENGIIDLLSDSDDEARNSIAPAAASDGPSQRKRASANGGDHNENEVVILSDDDDIHVAGSRIPVSTASSAIVHNPYAAKSCNVPSSKNHLDADKKTPGKPPQRKIHNPYKKMREDSETEQLRTRGEMNSKQKKTKLYMRNQLMSSNTTELQAGLVFEEDVNHIQPMLAQTTKTGSLKQSFLKKSASLKSSSDDESYEDQAPISATAYAQHQMATRISHNLPPVLFHDSEFTAGNPATIDGVNIINKSSKKSNLDQPVKKGDFILPPAPKCRCRPAKPCILAYSSKQGQNYGRPYYRCQNNSCKYFSWAFTSYTLHWYRFGAHNGHVLVKPSRGFRAEDLVQGKVGDCWFLSALAVVAERDDLIDRLVGANVSEDSDNFGLIEVRLFVDGYWKTIVIDDFLPCIIDSQNEKKEEDEIKLALQRSLFEAGFDSSCFAASASVNSKQNCNSQKQTSSRFDRSAIADECRTTLHDIQEFLHHDRSIKDPSFSGSKQSSTTLSRRATTSDLAYSKAKHNQLWVPFIEKAYAKMHGSYRAISGGHVAEAFLDLTGAPTAVYNFDHHNFNPKSFWSDLMNFRRKQLPMGCGTSSSQEGIVGMHAYSILDVREVKNVGAGFFYDKIAAGTLGNVSGFTDLDGTVRLLRIRNPHGQGEWKGEFSDKSSIWQRLLEHKNSSGNGKCVDLTKPMSPELERTYRNDGTFWIGYDDFLMGFSNVDVVLAFQGNHAKSFASNFPPKTSNHRSRRAFELAVVGVQPGEKSTNDEVEVFAMCIQKTRRGSYHGRADRKKSYKASDIGILVGRAANGSTDNENVELGDSVDGRFFGLTRNGHIRLVMSRRDIGSRMIIMPVSFGHPAATDEELSFVVRFVSDSPMLVRELAEPPKMNVAVQKFCFGSKITSLGVAGTSRHRGSHGTKTMLLERFVDGALLFRIIRVDCLAGDGGTVLFYSLVNDNCMAKLSSSDQKEAISFSIEVNCRGMACRTADGIEKHKVISKGKKFEAAWRRFSLQFTSENKSRLLAALVQSGQDYQVGSVKCAPLHCQKGAFSLEASVQKATMHSYESYEKYGIFASAETPNLNLSLPNTYQHGSVECDNDLSLALKKSREEYHAQMAKKVDHSVTPMKDSPVIELSDIDTDLKAAIMASMAETQTTANNNDDDENMKRAIELSLM